MKEWSDSILELIPVLSILFSTSLIMFITYRNNFKVYSLECLRCNLKFFTAYSLSEIAKDQGIFCSDLCYNKYIFERAQRRIGKEEIGEIE